MWACTVLSEFLFLESFRFMDLYWVIGLLGGKGAVLCFFPCTAFPTKVVKLHLVAKNRLIIHPGGNLRSGPWVSL